MDGLTKMTQEEKDQLLGVQPEERGPTIIEPEKPIVPVVEVPDVEALVVEAPPAEPEKPIEQPQVNPIEAFIAEVSGGKAKTADEYKALLSNQKPPTPIINHQTLLELDSKLRAEKNIGISDIVFWNSLDVAKLPEKDKMAYALKAQHADEPQSFIDMQIKRLSKLDDPTLSEQIEEGTVSQSEVEQLRVERDRLLHKADRILLDYKKNFEIEIAQQQQQSAPSEDAIAKAKLAYTEAASKLDKEIVQVKLPLELGEATLELPLTDADKESLNRFAEPGKAMQRYVKEDGSIDHGMIARDNYRIQNFDRIVQTMVQNAAAEAVARYQKSRDNVTDPKEKRLVEQKEESIFDVAAKAYRDRANLNY
jgi:hypothetical protein